MKPFRALLSFVIVVAVLFASIPYAGAIGFEAEAAYESVFVIYSGSSLGSGFAIGENCIITNTHVIENPRSITVETYGGTKHKATVLGMDEWQDIAVLIVEGATFPYLEVADLSSMKTGDDIYAIGAPRGMAYTLTKGGISAKERVVSGQTYIQIDAPINQGNSGGPLLNDAGQVLGVNTLKRSDSEGIGFAIPITRVCEYLESLGLALDAAGNVVGNPGGSPQPSTDSTEGTNPTNHQEESKSDENHPEYPNPEGPDNTSTIAAVAVIVAALSLATNVVLAALWIHERKKSVAVPYDPSERTDFEIDIWE